MASSVRLISRFDIFGGMLVAAALVTAITSETVRPLRPRRATRGWRWSGNAGFGALAAIVVRGAVVPSIEACAQWTAKRNVGLLRWLRLPRPVRAVVGFLALDYTMYLWHRALHDVGILWRFHGVHHADVDLDASTALRFHAGELVASLPFRCAQVAVLGVSPEVARTYELAMQTAAIFHHSNTRLPEALERAVGWAIVTPRLHGIHHSIDAEERQSNWSVLFSFWDRLHGTRRWSAEQPTIGLAPDDAPRRPSVVTPSGTFASSRP